VPSKKAKHKSNLPEPSTPPFSLHGLDEYVQREMEKTGKDKATILEETFHDGYVVINEAGESVFKVESGQLFKVEGDKKDDLAECRRLREKFGPISACVDYIKDIIMGSGYDIILDDLTDEHQKKIKKELVRWMRDIYQDIYTIGLNEILDILVDNALTDGFAASEIVYAEEPKNGSLFDDYAKPVTSSLISQESGKLAKSEYISYEVKEPVWSDLKGISRLKIILDAPTRLRLYRTRSWEANYWVLDEPSTSGIQTGMSTASQKNLQQSAAMQLTSAELVTSSMGKKTTAKPSAYFLPWQIFSLSLTRRSWLEKGASVVYPALRTAQLLEKIMGAVGEGIYRAGNKKFFIICGTKDRPWGAVHIRNLLSMLKDASEKNWSTVPVPAGFDLKEAGGTVFEAQNAINYFLRVIAGIMHVNPSVLGLDTREARNVTEVPYFTHLRMKENLQTQIEKQLIRLHIWTKYGQKKSKQGGYDEPQWIPQVRAKTEDLLNPADREKLDIDILNAANPVRGELKLEVERDIVKLRGWEVILPTQEEYKAEQEKLDAEMRKQQEKAQGEPQPPSEEKQQKRLGAGVSTAKTQSGDEKAPLKPMGSTRTPKEAKRVIQESLINEKMPEITKVGDTFVITNPFGVVAKGTEKDQFAGITVEIVELTDALARYNRDLSRIYMDPLVPIEFYKPIIAHEIFEYLHEEILKDSYAKSEKIATKLENEIVMALGMNPKVYEKKCTELLAIITKRTGVENPSDVVQHKGIEESKAEQHKVEITIKTEPIKTEKQEVEITLKEDSEKKKGEAEIREKKKKVLDKIEKKLEEDE
jgi:hypothetical protein